MRIRQQASWAMPDMSSIGRLAMSAAIGVVAAVLEGLLGTWTDAPAVGWFTAALLYSGSTWVVIWPMGPAETAAKARAEDPNRTLSDVLTLGASVASLASVVMVLISAHSVSGAGADALAGFALATIGVSWFTVHTVFALRYALLYYSPPEGGINFHQEEPPAFQDFCYLAMTLGMTFQVSDTDLGSTALRGTALRHALLSYLFGTVILAAVINLIAGLGSSGLFR